ncbi:site-specific integrase, partial [Kibdelosporangium philippinense]
MSALAPTLQAFFTDRLIRQRQASPHTIAAYRDAFKLLLAFTCHRTGSTPSRLRIEELTAPLIGDFLNHLETERGNS